MQQFLAGKGLGYEGQGFYESVPTNLGLIVGPLLKGSKSKPDYRIGTIKEKCNCTYRNF